MTFGVGIVTWYPRVIGDYGTCTRIGYLDVQTCRVFCVLCAGSNDGNLLTERR